MRLKHEEEKQKGGEALIFPFLSSCTPPFCFGFCFFSFFFFVFFCFCFCFYFCVLDEKMYFFFLFCVVFERFMLYIQGLELDPKRHVKGMVCNQMLKIGEIRQRRVKNAVSLHKQQIEKYLGKKKKGNGCRYGINELYCQDF